MKIEAFKEGGVLIVRPQEKRIDASIAKDFKSKLAEFVKNGNVNLVINLSEVDFIDSSGLGALVSTLKVIGNQGEIKLCEVKKEVKSIFELTRLDKVFSIYHSEKEAIDSFKE
jgi:anti-sigma B factor antagonist